jgi:hypothetical protein
VLVRRTLFMAARAERDGREKDAEKFTYEAISWMSASMRYSMVLQIYDEIQRDPAGRKRWFKQPD